MDASSEISRPYWGYFVVDFPSYKAASEYHMSERKKTFATNEYTLFYFLRDIDKNFLRRPLISTGWFTSC